MNDDLYDWGQIEVAQGSTQTVNPLGGSYGTVDPQTGSYQSAVLDVVEAALSDSGIGRILPRQVSTGVINSQLAIGQGQMRIDPSGETIRADQTGYDSGTGFWIGIDDGTPKLSIGNSAGNKRQKSAYGFSICQDGSCFG